MKLFSSFLRHFTAATLLLVGAVTEAQQDESTAEFQQRLSESFQGLFDSQTDVTAFWVGVADPLHGDLFWTFQKGNANVTVDDHFDIGSISKTFGGTVALLLSERGQLVLSDTVEQLVPAFAKQFPPFANYTVEEILRMDTLIPEYEPAITEVILANASVRLTIEEQVALVIDDFPGPAGEYSSTNYIALQLILETVTNTTMQQLLQDMILAPLGLVNTAMPPMDGDGVYPDPGSTPYLGGVCFDNTYEKYPNANGGAWNVGDDITDEARGVVQVGIAGSMYSTIGELLEWAKSGTGDVLLSPASVEARHQYDTPLERDSIGYGISQFEYKCCGYENWYGHSGGTLGYSTDAYRNNVLGGASFASGANTCDGNLGLSFLALYTSELISRSSSNSTNTPTTTPTTVPAPTSTEPAPTTMPSSLAPVSRPSLLVATVVGLVAFAV